METRARYTQGPDRQYGEVSTKHYLHPWALEPWLCLPVCLSSVLISPSSIYTGAWNVGILLALHCYLHNITSFFLF